MEGGDFGGVRRSRSGVTAAERFWSPRWRTAKQMSSVSSVMREWMRARPSGDAAAAGGEDLVAVAVDVEAEELAVLGVAAEDGADGVVGADLFEADAACW